MNVADSTTLSEELFCEGIHGTTGQVIEEGNLMPGALVRNVRCWDEAAFCDPDAPPAPKYAEPDTYTFLASTDGGMSWFLQRSRSAPVTE